MDFTSTTLVLAQDAVEGPGPRPFNPFEGILFPIVLGFVFVYFFLIRPQKREQEEKKRLIESLTKGDRVVTTTGMFGTIVNLKDDEVTLRVDDQAKVKIRFLRSAIARKVEGEAPKPVDEAKKS